MITGIFLLRSSEISRKTGALIVKHSCLILFWKSFYFCNFGTTGPFQVGFLTECNSPNEDFNQVENWKCHMFDFWLIPPDRITFYRLISHEVSGNFSVKTGHMHALIKASLLVKKTPVCELSMKFSSRYAKIYCANSREIRVTVMRWRTVNVLWCWSNQIATAAPPSKNTVSAF